MLPWQPVGSFWDQEVATGFKVGFRRRKCKGVWCKPLADMEEFDGGGDDDERVLKRLGHFVGGRTKGCDVTV